MKCLKIVLYKDSNLSYILDSNLGFGSAQNFLQIRIRDSKFVKLFKCKIRIYDSPLQQRYNRFEFRFDPNLTNLRILDLSNHMIRYSLYIKYSDNQISIAKSLGCKK